MRDSSNAHWVCLVVDISSVGLEDRMLQRGVVTGVRATGLPVTWGLGCREHADLLRECGPASKHEEAAIALGGITGEGLSSDELRSWIDLPFSSGLTHGTAGCEAAAKRLGLRVLVTPTKAGASAAQVRSLAGGLLRCVPNVSGAPPRRGFLSLFGRQTAFGPADLAAADGPSVVLVDSQTLVSRGASAVNRLTRKLDEIASLAVTGQVGVLPMGRFTDTVAESTQACPQRSILRAA